MNLLKFIENLPVYEKADEYLKSSASTEWRLNFIPYIFINTKTLFIKNYNYINLLLLVINKNRMYTVLFWPLVCVFLEATNFQTCLKFTQRF